jgi:hypothetical protein
VLFVPGNHEFDGRDIDLAGHDLRRLCTSLGIRLLEQQTHVATDDRGRRIRFCGTARWCDFDLFGEAGRARAMRAGTYFQRVMGSTRHGLPFDTEAVRALGQECRAWLAQTLREPPADRWDKTVVITHFAPSLRSADPRYGRQPTTASFCNADDDLIPRADMWIHGHLHARFDYEVARADAAPTRVVCQSRGLEAKKEPAGFDPLRIFEV